MKSFLSALLFFFSAAVLAAGNGVKVPPFERVQLSNGAVVLLMERHDVPLIAFSAVLRGGAVSDPADESGLASLLAGLLLGLGYRLLNLDYPALLALVSALAWLVPWLGVALLDRQGQCSQAACAKGKSQPHPRSWSRGGKYSDSSTRPGSSGECSRSASSSSSPGSQ